MRRVPKGAAPERRGAAVTRSPRRRLRESLAQAEPEAGPAQLEQLLEQRVSFASTCCLPGAAPLLCAAKVPHIPPFLRSSLPRGQTAPGLPLRSSLLPQVSSELGEVCNKESCLLG